jgi:predicted nucleotidyltransferase
MHMLEYKFIEDISKLASVDRIVLYGSRARGDNQARSDIDLAVDCKNASSEDWHKILELVENNKDTLLKVDCIRLDKLEASDRLKANIEKHGITIYSKYE